MNILKASELYLEAWLHLRNQLWQESDEAHLEEMREILASQTTIVFLMFAPDEEPIGFIEGALYLNNSQSYGYVEGWFVVPAFRRQGLGGQLLGKLEEWFLHHTIDLSLSDTIPEEYPLSTAAHAKHGYQEWTTLQIFMKQLDK